MERTREKAMRRGGGGGGGGENNQKTNKTYAGYDPSAEDWNNSRGDMGGIKRYEEIQLSPTSAEKRNLKQRSGNQS